VSTAALKPAFRSLTVLTKATGAGRRSICECKISVLISLPDERAQITAGKAVLGDDLRPHIGVVADIGGKAGGLIGSKLHPQASLPRLATRSAIRRHRH
jgi:hypothetical protein